MKKIFFAFLFVVFTNIQAQQTQPVLELITPEELQNLVHQNDDVLYVVNYWATWCSPCVREIPGFMNVHKQYQNDSNFKMILVSLDAKRLLDTKVKRFVERHNIDTDVYVLDDTGSSTIEVLKAIDSNWYGEIPATLFYKNGQKLKFHKGSMTQYELEDLVDDFL